MTDESCRAAAPPNSPEPPAGMDKVPLRHSGSTPPTRPCSPDPEGDRNYDFMGNYWSGQDSQSPDEVPRLLHSAAWERSIWELLWGENGNLRGVRLREMDNTGDEQIPGLLEVQTGLPLHGQVRPVEQSLHPIEHQPRQVVPVLQRGTPRCLLQENNSHL